MTSFKKLCALGLLALALGAPMTASASGKSRSSSNNSSNYYTKSKKTFFGKIWDGIIHPFGLGKTKYRKVPQTLSPSDLASMDSATKLRTEKRQLKILERDLNKYGNQYEDSKLAEVKQKIADLSADIATTQAAGESQTVADAAVSTTLTPTTTTTAVVNTDSGTSTSTNSATVI